MCAKNYENPTMLSRVTAKNVGDVFFLRFEQVFSVVVVELVGVVVSGPNVVSSSDGPSVLLSSRPRMSLSRFGSCCYSLCNDKSPT